MEASLGNPVPSAAIDQITSRSPMMEEVKRLIRLVAASDITALVDGESGTGKELVARAIHQMSRRRNGPLVSVNCGAIPEGIFESEIFGHEKGSFTSAGERRKGYFEMAHRGTLFLDEIGEMPLSVQVKILRVLESGTFLRVGGSEEVNVDVRVVAATNKDLKQEVARGLFRQDLYFRLRAVNINIPPLRDRSEDIPLLVQQFASEFAARNNRPAPEFEPEAIASMKRHYWAGNVRELKNFVESVVALSQSRIIAHSEVEDRLRPSNSTSNLPVLINRPSEDLDRELLYRTLLELRSDMSTVKNLLQGLLESRTREVNSHFVGAEEVETFTLDEMEKEQIRRALQEFGGNRRLAARSLGIGERTLYRKIDRYGLS
jgi:DNA-binding NtrC family response regulator